MGMMAEAAERSGERYVVGMWCVLRGVIAIGEEKANSRKRDEGMEAE
jgi:hypothetical protein